MTQNNRTLLLKKSLLEFYERKSYMDIIVSILNKKTEYSLRLLEWFCSNYSKKYNVIYPLAKNKDFNVYLSYKAQLDSYQKKQFDPFKRDHPGYGKFTLEYSPGKFIETTVCQLNFFKWCIENKILEYIKENLTKIKNDMNESLNYKSEPVVDGTKKTRKKRKPLTSTSLTFTKRSGSITIKF
jgi:hypothetical protein